MWQLFPQRFKSGHHLAKRLTTVRAIHSTNGRRDLIIESGTATLEEFGTTLAQIRRLGGVMQSETGLLLATCKSAS